MSTPNISRHTVSQKHVLYSEILAVTSAMRKNSRWASSTHFVNAHDSGLANDLGLRISSPGNASKASRVTTRESDLMTGFQELKRAIRDVEGKSQLATLPFKQMSRQLNRCWDSSIDRSTRSILRYN
jgi:golgi-specific brefeldin A-resistance guanine nucleotide exchange factor 1